MDTNNDRLNFHIVLYKPEIPANTGNIGRLCVGANAKLHIIKPMRFLLSDKQLARAGLDYWDKLNIELHDSIEQIYMTFNSKRIYLCSTKGNINYCDIDYDKGDVFIFGPESQGLPELLLSSNKEQVIKIPMSENIRSINLANSVSIILFEAWRQIGFKL